MTSGWFFFSIVMPAIVAGGGVLYSWAYLRSLRKEETKRNRPAE